MFNLINFLTYAAITAATPGPNNIICMANGGKYGIKKGLPFSLGVLTGFSIIMSITTIFWNILASVMPQIQNIMLVFGSGYMLFYGI